MDFYEEIELYNEAMENAYLIITKRVDLDEMCELIENGHEFPLPFNPLETLQGSPEIIDLIVEYYISIEDYEKCTELTKVKEKCLKTRTK
tara:strand:+ start:208 stop:477 length:270 start_codon:yes stop_codon:yes gene_type:complete